MVCRNARAASGPRLSETRLFWRICTPLLAMPSRIRASFRQSALERKSSSAFRVPSICACHFSDSAAAFSGFRRVWRRAYRFRPAGNSTLNPGAGRFLSLDSFEEGIHRNSRDLSLFQPAKTSFLERCDRATSEINLVPSLHHLRRIGPFSAGPSLERCQLGLGGRQCAACTRAAPCAPLRPPSQIPRSMARSGVSMQVTSVGSSSPSR